MSFKQHLCWAPERLPASPHKGLASLSPICPPISSQEIPLSPGATGGRWSVTESLQLPRILTLSASWPPTSCYGYRRSRDEAKRVKWAQLCSMSYRVAIDNIRAAPWSPRSCRRRSGFGAVLPKVEENSGSSKEPNEFFESVKEIPIC